MKRFLFFQILLFEALLLFPPAALSAPFFGPDMKGDISALVNGISEESPLPAGWELRDFSFTDTDINVRLGNIAGGGAVMRLAHPSFRSHARRAGASRNFVIELADVRGAISERDATALAAAFAERIRKNDVEFIYDHPGMKARQGRGMFLMHRYVFRPAVLIGLLAIVLLAAVNARFAAAELLPAGRPGRAALVVIFVVALSLRLFVPPDAPAHANNHGVREIRAMIYLESPEPKDVLYGKVYPFIMQSAAELFGRSERVIYAVNAVCGALAVMGLYLLAAALLPGARGAAVAAAAMFAVSPALVWISHTEAPAAMHLMFALPGLALITPAVRASRASLLWLSALLIAFAGTLHIYTLLIIPVAVIYYIAAVRDTGRAPGRAFRTQALNCAAVVLLWAAFHVFSLAPGLAAKGAGEISLIRIVKQSVGISNILFDPLLTPTLIPVLAMIGIIIAARARLGFLFRLIAAAVFILPVSLIVNACQTDALRYQSTTQWIFFIAAAVPLLHLIRGDASGWKKALPVAISALIFFQSYLGLLYVGEGVAESKEYEFVTDYIKSVPRDTVIRLPAPVVDGGNMIIDFPDYTGGHRLVRGKSAAPAGADEIIFMGLDCWRFTDKKELHEIFSNGVIWPECSTLCEERFAPEKQLWLNDSGRFIWRHRRFYDIARPRFAVGFYRCAPATRPPD